MYLDEKGNKHYALIWDAWAQEYVEGSPYNRGKIRARKKAQDWQNNFADHDYSFDDCLDFQGIFERLGRRYGLLTEFRENGLI